MDRTTTINYSHDDVIHNTSASKEVLPFILKKVNPVNSILDVGCGTGTWLNTALSLGIKDIQGLDGVKIENKKLHISAESIIIHDLNLPINLKRKYDLTVCLEVVEHLPESAARNIIDILTLHSDVILFSAAIPNQGGQFHINEQWPEYWQKLFLEKGFYPFDILRKTFWENKNVEWWYKQNMIIYSKKNNPQLSLETPEDHIMPFIHPQLLELKLDEIHSLNKIIKNYIHKPKIINSFKLFLKSLIK